MSSKDQSHKGSDREKGQSKDKRPTVCLAISYFLTFSRRTTYNGSWWWAWPCLGHKRMASKISRHCLKSHGQHQDRWWTSRTIQMVVKFTLYKGYKAFRRHLLTRPSDDNGHHYISWKDSWFFHGNGWAWAGLGGYCLSIHDKYHKSLCSL